MIDLERYIDLAKPYKIRVSKLDIGLEVELRSDKNKCGYVMSLERIHDIIGTDPIEYAINLIKRELDKLDSL